MRTIVLAALAATLLLSGCGGGSSSSGGSTVKADDQASLLAYENGYQQCTGFSLKDLQQTYSADAPTKEAIGIAVARSNPGQPELQEPTKRGCMDAIDKKPFTPSGQPGG